jgi:hypothetical protein
VQLEREDRTEEDKHYLVALTRRKSICSIVSTGLVVPLVGVVSSSNIPARLHLGVGSETFLGRYFQFFSHERSRILVHRVFGDEIRACSYTKCRFPCSSPEPFSTSLLNITLAVPFFSPNTSIVRPYGLRQLAPIPATTSA